jgi:hypothetical protein
VFCWAFHRQRPITGTKTGTKILANAKSRETTPTCPLHRNHPAHFFYRLHQMPMKNRFRLIHRGERGGQFYCVDSKTGQRSSLKTKDRDVAEQLVLAKNQANRQPMLNRQIAKAYLPALMP